MPVCAGGLRKAEAGARHGLSLVAATAATNSDLINRRYR